MMKFNPPAVPALFVESLASRCRERQTICQGGLGDPGVVGRSTSASLPTSRGARSRPESLSVAACTLTVGMEGPATSEPEARKLASQGAPRERDKGDLLAAARPLPPNNPRADRWPHGG